MPTKLIRLALILITTLVVCVCVLFTSLYIGHRATLTLPAPSGPFAVARHFEEWRDEKRPDPLVATARTNLVVWFWYPTPLPATGKRSEQLPAHWVRAALARQTTLGKVFGIAAGRGEVFVHSVEDGPVADDRPRYPVVILRGGGGALTTEFTVFAEDLASHGYIVVGFDAPYRSGLVVFADGHVVERPPDLNPETMTADETEHFGERLVAAWVADMRFVVDRMTAFNASGKAPFRGRLDLDKIGAVGHSLGGASTAQFCHDDARCSAGVDMDGRLFGTVISEGVPRPFLFLLSDHSGTKDATDLRILGDIRSAYELMPAGTRAALAVQGATHFNYSQQLMVRNPVALRIARAIGALKLDPQRGVVIARDVVRTFFDVHLRNADPSAMQEVTRKYGEIHAGLP